MILLGIIFWFVYGAIGRVWFGADDLPKILQNRGLQTAYMLFGLMAIYCPYPFNWVGVVLAVAVSCWLQFQFWSRGHGCCFDVGRSGQPDAATLIRYNERWYHYPCDWLFEKVFKKVDKKWGFLYDFFYLTLRYTCPMIPMMIFDWRYILVGLSVAPIYAFSITLGERESWVFEKQKWYWRRAWSLAEILSGGVVYSSCYLLGL
jgi:hypothetical protein